MHQGKNKRLAILKIGRNRTNKVLDLIHSDVCGPINTPTIGGKTYFLTFIIIDCSRFTIIYLLSIKSEVLEQLKEYVAMIHKKIGKKLKITRSDNGGEYINCGTEDFLNTIYNTS